MSGKVFISYSRRDLHYVEQLAAHLAANGILVWFDRDIDPGEHLERVLIPRIDSCVAFVVVMSPASATSEWVGVEIARARLRGRTILPILLDGDVFPIFGVLNYIDVRDQSMPGEAFVARLQDLQADSSPANAERSANRVLSRADGPVDRYRAAVEVEGDDPLTAGGERLPSPPAQGSAFERLVSYASLLPRAADRLESLADQAALRAERRRRLADQEVARLEQPLPPLSQTPAFQPPAPSGDGRDYRRLSIRALISVLLVVVAFVYGSGAYTQGRDQTGDLLRALAGLAVLVFCGITLWNWLLTTPSGLRALGRDAAARRRYNALAATRDAARRAHEQADRERRSALAAATTHRTQEHRAASELDAYARRARQFATSAGDPELRAELSLIIGRRGPG